MGITGWVSEAPDAEGPAMPVTEHLLARREHRAGAVETALARSAADDRRAAREAAEQARDPDEYAATLIGRGYLPGMVSQLSMKLADVMAELEDEEAKLAKAARRSRQVHEMHSRGQIRAWDIPQMLGDDLGDEGRVRQLEHQAASLRRQIGEAHEAISPPRQREPDGVEAAASRARSLLAEVTRSQAPARQAPPPFGSASRFAGRSTEHTPDGDCWVCAEGRRRDAARYSEGDTAAFAPGSVITTGYREIAR